MNEIPSSEVPGKSSHSRELNELVLADSQAQEEAVLGVCGQLLGPVPHGREAIIP